MILEGHPKSCSFGYETADPKRQFDDLIGVTGGFELWYTLGFLTTRLLAQS